MRVFPRAGLVLTTAWALVVGLLLYGTGSAQARPEYKKGFDNKYKTHFDKAGTKIDCNTCHVKDKKKTERNVYGMDYGTTLGAKKVKDMKKIEDALVGIEDKDSPVSGKKYIDLIKEGKFPAGNDPS